MTQEQEDKILKEIKDSKGDGCANWIIIWLLVTMFSVLINH